MRRLKTSELASHQGAWLIFDFGNVLIEIDPARSIQAFQALGAPADLNLEADFFHDFETGIHSAAGFRDALRGQLKWAASESSIDRAWLVPTASLPQTLEYDRALSAGFTTSTSRTAASAPSVRSALRLSAVRAMGCE